MKGITATMMPGLLCLVFVANVRAAATLNNFLQTNGSLVISWDSRGTLEKADQPAPGAQSPMHKTLIRTQLRVVRGSTA